MRLFSPIFFIALGLFGVYTIEFGVVGILPVIVERYDVSVAQAGLLVGGFALVIAVCGPWVVLKFSRYNRKRVLTTCLWIFAISSALSAYASNYGTLMVLRIVPAPFHPLYFSLAFVAAISLYPPERATQATAHAFIGTSMGMVLGVPITTWIAAQFSYETAWLFCTVVNVVAGIGILAWLPDTHAGQKTPYGEQLAILRKPALWLNIAASTMIFAAMFSVYAYSAEYLARKASLSAEVISLLLIVFGVGGIAGNLLAGKWLTQRKALTTILHPVLLAVAYALVYAFASPDIWSMTAIVLFWGAVHTSGLIVTQVWLTGEAPEAPEFVTGLYISFINLGVTLGSTAGGLFINLFGLHGTLISGALFCATALGLIVLKLAIFGDRRKSVMFEASNATQ